MLDHADRWISVSSPPMVAKHQQHVEMPECCNGKIPISKRSDLHPRHGGDARSVGGGSGGGGLSSVCRANSGGGGAAVAAVEASAAAHRK